MALTQYYVDPAINGNSGTGTVGDPFGDLQYALNTITRDATNGDQFNVKAGTAEVLGAPLTLATYGTPTADAPLVLRGYSSAANDGGRATVSGAGSYAIIGSTNHIHFVDCRLTNCGGNVNVTLNAGGSLIRCEIDTNTGNNTLVNLAGANNQVVGCFLHDNVQRGVHVNGAGALILSCYFNNCGQGSFAAIDCDIAGGNVIGNIVKINHTSARGIRANYGYNWINGNVVYATVPLTGGGISVSNSSGRVGHTVINNVLVGMSGAGGAGIMSSSQQLGAVGHNAFYNCTANYSLANGVIVDFGGDVTLAADPFTDAANGDFSLTTAAQAALRSAGWPATYLGAHANTDPHITIGALQYGPTPTGGGIYQRVMRLMGG